MSHRQHLLVTGGTGFFGRALLRHWMDRHARGQAVPCVTVLTRRPDAFTREHPELSSFPWLNWHQGDILRPDSLPAAGAGFTHLLHAATDSTLGPNLTPLERYLQIVDGTRNMLEYAVAHDIGRFLLTSSGGVYGPQPSELEKIPEHYHGMPDPLNAQHAYSVAKRCAEHLCALYQDRYGLQTVIARCFAFVGRDLPLDVHFAIGNFIRDALSARPITVQGDGTALRSYMDQRDLAVWLSTLLEQGRPGQAYNVGSDEAISIRALAHLVRDLLAPGQAIHILRQADPRNFRNRYIPSVDKARADLGLTLNHRLPDAIKTTAYPQ